MARAIPHRGQRSTRDSLDEIADDLIARYSKALGQGGANWSAIRKGLQIVIREMSERASHHPALQRLERFVEEQDRKSTH